MSMLVSSSPLFPFPLTLNPSYFNPHRLHSRSDLSFLILSSSSFFQCSKYVCMRGWKTLLSCRDTKLDPERFFPHTRLRPFHSFSFLILPATPPFSFPNLLLSSPSLFLQPYPDILRDLANPKQLLVSTAAQ